MRQPSGILFLLACLLAVVPLMQRSAAQERCESYGVSDDVSVFRGLGDDSTSACAAMLPPQPAWVNGLAFLAVLCFGAGVVTGAVALRDRRREAELLRGAGLNSYGDDLPRQ